MADAHLYLALGLPALALVLGIVGNGLLFNALSARMTSLENRMSTLEAHFDLMMRKLSEIDSRLSVLEDRSKR